MIIITISEIIIKSAGSTTLWQEPFCPDKRQKLPYSRGRRQGLSLLVLYTKITNGVQLVILYSNTASQGNIENMGGSFLELLNIVAMQKRGLVKLRPP